MFSTKPTLTTLLTTETKMSKTRDFYKAEKIRLSSLIREVFFGSDEHGNGKFSNGICYPFVLQQEGAPDMIKRFVKET